MMGFDDNDGSGIGWLPDVAFAAWRLLRALIRSDRGAFAPISGLFASCLVFGSTIAVLIFFGVLLEADGELSVVPAPAITFLFAAAASSRRWQVGFVAGLAGSCVGMTYLVGPWALLLYVLPIVVAWVLGRFVARRRATGAQRDPAIGRSGQAGHPAAHLLHTAAAWKADERDPRVLIAGIGALALFGVVAWELAGAPERPPASEPNFRMVASSEVIAGQCFDEVLVDQVSGVYIRSCDTPHEYEMFATETYPAGADAPFPGDATLADHADRTCSTAFIAYVGIPPDTSTLTWAETYPTEDGWSYDDRRIACWVGDVPPAAPLVGSVRGSKQ